MVAIGGLAVGSFLNVVISRLPVGESLSRPRSRCPHCGAAITPRDNVPVASWLLLRGRCRTCRRPIAARYPAVEAGTALLFAIAEVRFGLGWELWAYLLLFSVAMAAAGISLDGHRLPARLPLVGITGCSAALLVSAATRSAWSALIGAVVGAGIGVVAMRVVERRADAATTALAALSGLALGWLGWKHLGLGFLLAAVARTRLPPAAALALACVVASLMPL